jgi:hypothetical protein
LRFFPQHCEERASEVKSAAVAKGDDSEAGNNADDACKPPVWARYFAWPEGVGAWAVILTLFIIAWQSIETRDAAKGAFLNAQAVINAERPWIVVSIKTIQGPMGGFKIYARNKGRTPALVIDSRMNYVLAKDVVSLPASDYPFDTMIKDKLIFPSRSAFFMWFDGRTVRGCVKKNVPYYRDEGQVYICGRVRYRDLLNPDSKIVHETRWISLYQTSSEGDEIHPIEGIGLSTEYEKYT